MEPLQPGDPRQVGDYVLSGRLGAGGMGEVFLGRTPGGLRVAVKLISPVFAKDADFRRRFRLEVEAARKVGGFYTAQVVDARPDADRPWLVTAYVAGPSLARAIADHGALPVRSVRMLGSGLAEALQAIHADGLVHRDLKPSNVLLAADGPRVIDFGTARAMDASGVTAVIGTPGFMAPEVLTGEAATSACDIFALGMVLAFASGVRPFGEGPSEAVGYRVVHQQPDLSGLDTALRDVVAGCLAKPPADRPDPGQVLRQLASPALESQWLPAPVSALVTAQDKQHQPTAVAGGDPVRAARLLGVAEHLARAVPGEPWRGRALVHVAAITARSDPAHAARLFDDALHPPIADPRHVRTLVDLAWHAPDDIAAVLTTMDTGLARRLIADLEAIAQSLGQDSNGQQVIAAIVAAADASRARLIAGATPHPVYRAWALDAVSRVVAQSDITQAAQIARNIGGPDMFAAPGGWRGRRPSGKQRRTPADPAIRLVQAKALAYLAVAAAGVAAADRVQVSALDGRTVAANRPDAESAAHRAEAEVLLAEAESIALGLPDASDERARALVAVTSAAAQVWPERGSRLLAQAEQHARAIADQLQRQLTLGIVAMVAARTDLQQAEQIGRSLTRPAELHPLALALARSDQERAMQLAARTADPYLTAIVKAIAAMRTAHGRALQALQEAADAAPNFSQVIQAAVLAAPLDPDWAEQAITPGDLNNWRERYLMGDDMHRRHGMLEYEQARGLADLADTFLSGNAGPSVILV
jgi:hypothetical protein